MCNFLCAGWCVAYLTINITTAFDKLSFPPVLHDVVISYRQKIKTRNEKMWGKKFKLNHDDVHNSFGNAQTRKGKPAFKLADKDIKTTTTTTCLLLSALN